MANIDIATRTGTASANSIVTPRMPEWVRRFSAMMMDMRGEVDHWMRVTRYAVTVSPATDVLAPFADGRVVACDVSFIRAAARAAASRLIMRVVEFDRPMGFDLAVRAMRRTGHRPATAEELVLFTLSHPEVLGDRTSAGIVGAGTAVDLWATRGGVAIPAMRRSADGRPLLDAVWMRRGRTLPTFQSRHAFLAVETSS